jgi:glycosyltransferase involved in cell wall biosynthesis
MNNGSSLVSVIIPCFYVATYVEKAVQSILSQSYKNLEIWIIDDASTDNTLQKINAIKDNRIQVIAFNENTQKVGAVNEILQKVNGEFIAFQDADDWSEPERIQEQLKEFQKDPELGISFTNYRYVGAKTFLPGKIALTNEELRNEFLNYTYKRPKRVSPTNCPTMMISRPALQKTKGYSSYFAGRVAEDIQWIYRILKDFKGVTVDKVLYNYNLRKGSFTQIQSTGIKPKYAYSWQLLSKIIYKDIHERINVLAPENKGLLSQLELEACEDALVENIQLLNKTINTYENSTSFKIGKLLLTPWRLLKSLKGNRIS